MARPRAPEREQAKDIWLQSGGKLPLSQLAKEVNVSVGTIRSWKSKDGWVNQLEAQQPKKKRGAPKGSHNARGHGAPKGNHNARGHGAPRNNKNGMKHGAFERFAFMFMEDDEKQVAKETEVNSVEAELLSTLAFLKARELRLMKRIAAIRELNAKMKNMMISSISTKKSEKKTGTFTEDENGKMVKDPGTGFFDGEMSTETTTNTSSTEDALNKLESELSKVQAQKVKVLAQLDLMKVNRERLAIERLRAQGENEQSKLANEWVEALLEVYSEESDEAAEDGEADE
jgi:uncharacterized protein YjcR